MKNIFLLALMLLLGISVHAAPANFCDDATFLRRVYLKTTGIQPSSAEVVAFLQSKDENKRLALVKQVLSSESHHRYMTMRWGDVLRIKSEFPSNLWPNGVQAYNRWLYQQIALNKGYDEFVRDLLLSKGSNFKQPGVNFYRAFQDRSPKLVYENIHLIFMGEQQVCDSLHVCFSQMKYKSTKEWKEEIVYPDVWKDRPSESLMLPNGDTLAFKQHTDWRAEYVEWLTGDDNIRFAQVQVNRLWYWMLGEGLFTSPDPVRWSVDKSSASTKSLQNKLTSLFIESGYDQRRLLQEILLSDRFQATIESGLFPVERLSAETIVDGLAMLTGEYDRYRSRVPEPFTFYPLYILSRDLGDATVSSPTLELFGRASRDVSLESQHDLRLTDRQVLYMMNANDLEGRLRSSRSIAQLVEEVSSMPELVRQIFLRVLLRYPSQEEMLLFTQHAQVELLSKRELAYDLYWVLLNSNEYLFIY